MARVRPPHLRSRPRSHEKWRRHVGRSVATATVLPLRLVEDERVLVASGIHSRRRAADELGVEDPEGNVPSVPNNTMSRILKAPPTGRLCRVRAALICLII